jgi:hypothetical protein
LPKDKLCALNELQLNAKNPTEDSIDKREMYAKMALLMFYPFQQLTDLTCNKSYWKKFHQELTNHNKNEKNNILEERVSNTSEYTGQRHTSKACETR